MSNQNPVWNPHIHVQYTYMSMQITFATEKWFYGHFPLSSVSKVKICCTLDLHLPVHNFYFDSPQKVKTCLFANAELSQRTWNVFTHIWNFVNDDKIW